ncbi:MAG: DUF2206 domain-containing protein [Halobacteriota archaeon]
MCVTLALLLALMLFCSLGTLAVAAAQTGASDRYTVSTPVGLNYVPSMFSDSKNVYTVAESTNITFSAAPSAFMSVLVNVVAPYVIIAVVTGLAVVLLYLYVRHNVRRERHVTHLQAASRRRPSSSMSRRALRQNERTGAQQPHKPEIHIKLNDVSVQNLLAVVLSLQIALWALIGLNALGISIPIVQPLIGFIYLTFVPGILVLTALRMRDLAIVEIALYAVGLSVTSVLSIGLVANIVFNASNTIKPFSVLAVTSSISFVVLVLCAIAYFRNRTHPKPLFTTEMSAPLAPTLFLCILPFMAVFSTYLVNTYNLAAGQLVLWLILGIVVLLIAFDKIIPSKVYSLAVFVIALSLVLQQTLISAWLTGADIQTEWSLANAVLNTGVWNPNLLSQYNGMLSVVTFAPIYSLISSLDLLWVFKIVYPVIFALVPVGLYQIFRRQLNEKVAFLSCFFFMSFAPFYVQLTTLARQEVAELFFVLLILLLVSKEMKPRVQSALFMVFGVSLVVSHYGLFFIALSFLFAMWLVLSVAPVIESNLSLPYLRTKIGIHKDKQVITPSPRSPERRLVTIVSISVLFIASTAWYFYTAQGAITQQVVALGSHIAGALGETFSPTYSQAANVVKKGPLVGILHGLNAYVNYLNLFFVVVGVCLAVFLKKQRFKLQFSYVVLAIIALGFLIASIAVPYLGAALDWTRVLQITLFFLAPFLAIGFITIGETAGATMRKVIRKLGFGNLAPVSRSHLTRLLAIYLVLFMLLSTGFLFALTEGYQNIALSNQIDGEYSPQTIAGATWQASNIATIPLAGKPVTIYHYLNNIRYDDATKPTNSSGQVTLDQTFSSAGTYYYYATFAGDGSYDPASSTVANVNVGSNQSSNQSSNQATANIGRVAQSITLAMSTTTPAVGQSVTFTATLTGRQIVYGDYHNLYILGDFGVGGQAQIPGYIHNETAPGSNVFLGTYNIEHNVALLLNFTGVNAQVSYSNVTPLISNRSLIYSNGGASVYS